MHFADGSVCLLADAPEGFEGDEQSRAPAGLHLLSSYYGNTASIGGWGVGSYSLDPLYGASLAGLDEKVQRRQRLNRLHEMEASGVNLPRILNVSDLSR
jgi:hypothetical protein